MPASASKIDPTTEPTTIAIIASVRFEEEINEPAEITSRPIPKLDHKTKKFLPDSTLYLLSRGFIPKSELPLQRVGIDDGFQIVSRRCSEWLFTLSVWFLRLVGAICFLRKFKLGRTVVIEIYSQVTWIFAGAFLFLVGIVRFVNLNGVCLSMRGNNYTL